MGDRVESYCNYCQWKTYQWLPDYRCEKCGRANPPVGRGEEPTFGCGLIAAIAFFVLICVAFLAVNSLLLLPLLLSKPWAPAISTGLVVWLWRRDHLNREKWWLRFGLSAFLIVFMGLLLIAISEMVAHQQVLRMGKELLLVTLPGFAAGWFAGRSFGRPGALWPAFTGICLAHTVGKATVLGWIFGRYLQN